MAEELNKPNPPVDTVALMAEVEALRKSKAESVSYTHLDAADE